MLRAIRGYALMGKVRIIGILFSGTVLVTGCNTTGDGVRAALGQADKKIAYKSVIDETQDEALDPGTLEDWLDTVLLVYRTEFPDDSICVNEESKNLSVKTLCFQHLHKAPELRDSFVQAKLVISNLRCRKRAENIANVLTGVDTGENFLTTLASTTGLAASDAVTARAASGVIAVTSQLFDGARTDLLRNVNIMAEYADINERRLSQREIMRAKAMDDDGKRKHISEYSLMEAVNDIDRYDRACDFIN
ncbi:MAG: hypothetical protein WBF53_02960 [Litorimonas sp.]